MGSESGKERDGALDEHPYEGDGLEEDEAVARWRERVDGKSGHGSGIAKRAKSITPEGFLNCIRDLSGAGVLHVVQNDPPNSPYL